VIFAPVQAMAAGANYCISGFPSANWIEVGFAFQIPAKGKCKPWNGFNPLNNAVGKIPIVAVRTCRVSCCDLKRVEHTVQVTAGRLYEAVAQGLRAFRENDWVDDIGRGLPTITVVISQPEIEHRSLKRLLLPAPSELLVMQPASPLVNSVKNEGAELLHVQPEPKILNLL